MLLSRQDGVVAISMVEEGYRKEKQAKEAIEKEIKSSFLPELEDVDDALDGGADENRLLPMMNKIWPFLVLCMKNNTSVVSHLFCLHSNFVYALEDFLMKTL